MTPKVIQVIQSETIRGDGRVTVMRPVIQYYTLDGEFLAENDPLAGKSDSTTGIDNRSPAYWRNKLEHDQSRDVRATTDPVEGDYRVGAHPGVPC